MKTGSYNGYKEPIPLSSRPFWLTLTINDSFFIPITTCLKNGVSALSLRSELQIEMRCIKLFPLNSEELIHQKGSPNQASENVHG
ncbi:hypothetical protein TNCV_2458141 [Trichonephila clavipes]|nr:hypothetical protein TNCV_2458141 [Trichonephila clavipes]